ncbi:uncharacterized protein LOC120163993 [Hibiscus syriacus]|uniref:uncharacterized protein LOC120163993 n=1 Tax=Hibiscus syriacus TaxID=106335 RepID=UPI0019224F75|nr:uncharacterized protein LOC120163993 [Hibiscus syriacus]
MERSVPANKPKAFKFFNFWTAHPEFLKLVRESWDMPVVGDLMLILFRKLKRLERVLKRLNRQCYDDISSRVAKEKKLLEEQQVLNFSGKGNDEDAAKERAFSRELGELEKIVNFYRQRTKIRWLQEGDMGTHFFHSLVAMKKKRETIRVLHDEAGRKLESFEEISSEAVEFFISMIGRTDSAVMDCDMVLLRDIMNYSLLADVALLLTKEVSNEEIRLAIFQ